MSKTDKTAPWWVQAQDQLWQPTHLCVRFHRECDLPSEPPRSHNEAEDRWGKTLCWWSPTDWHKITFSRYNEDWAHPSRAKREREWRKDWGL